MGLGSLHKAKSFGQFLSTLNRHCYKQAVLKRANGDKSIQETY